MFFDIPVIDRRTCYDAREKGLAFFEVYRTSNGKITIGNKTFNRAAMRLRRAHRCLRTKYKIPFDSTLGRSGSIFEKKNRIELGIFFSKISDWIEFVVFLKMCGTRRVTRKLQRITYGGHSSEKRPAWVFNHWKLVHRLACISAKNFVPLTSSLCTWD